MIIHLQLIQVIDTCLLSMLHIGLPPFTTVFLVRFTLRCFLFYFIGLDLIDRVRPNLLYYLTNLVVCAPGGLCATGLVLLIAFTDDT